MTTNQRRPSHTPSRRPPDATERVPPYETLKRAILSGEFKPGQQLIETTLAEWCDVSRTPIREALRRLEQDGLIMRSDRGMIVRERSPDEILDIYETRIVLEATVGRVAAERRTDHDLRNLQRTLRLCQEIGIDDHGAMVDANERFHRTVWRACHNESLVDVLERLNLHLSRYPGTTLGAPGRWAAALREHAELVEAIEKRDSNRAYQIALQHFTAAREIRLKLFSESDDL